MLTSESPPPKGGSRQTTHTPSAPQRLEFSRFSVINSGQRKSVLPFPSLGEATLLDCGAR